MTLKLQAWIPTFSGIQIRCLSLIQYNFIQSDRSHRIRQLLQTFHEEALPSTGTLQLIQRIRVLVKLMGSVKRFLQNITWVHMGSHVLSMHMKTLHMHGKCMNMFFSCRCRSLAKLCIVELRELSRMFPIVCNSFLWFCYLLFSM